MTVRAKLKVYVSKARHGSSWPVPDAALATVVPLPVPVLAEVGARIVLLGREGNTLLDCPLAELVGTGKLLGGFVVSPGPGGPPGVPLLRKETPQ